MKEKVLGIKEIYPSEEILGNVLGTSYTAYRKLIDELSEYGIFPEWNYYNDYKSWLCKLLLKKKNLAWLDVETEAFNVNCYFLERHVEAVENSDISEDIKEKFYTTKVWGRMIAMPIHNDSDRLDDNIMKMILLKKGLK